MVGDHFTVRIQRLDDEIQMVVNIAEMLPGYLAYDICVLLRDIPYGFLKRVNSPAHLHQVFFKTEEPGSQLVCGIFKEHLLNLLDLILKVVERQKVVVHDIIDQQVSQKVFLAQAALSFVDVEPFDDRVENSCFLLQKGQKDIITQVKADLFTLDTDCFFFGNQAFQCDKNACAIIFHLGHVLNIEDVFHDQRMYAEMCAHGFQSCDVFKPGNEQPVR
jgi:hypothetical protein